MIDYITWKRNAARRKILGVLPRSVVDRMSGIEFPGSESYKVIADACVDRWDDNLARDAIDALLDRAKGRDLP